MIKVAAVIQRYGQDVVGGAETLAKDICERLNRIGYDVTVFTTIAKDYITWKNDYKPGNTILKGVEIRRYEVEKERDINYFNDFSRDFFSGKRSRSEEKEWIDLQGPYSPKLKRAVEEEQANFDVFIFFTYLYYTTVNVISSVKKPVILFPTAHDEPPFKLGVMKKVFLRPDSFFFLTGAEMELVKRTFSPKNKLNLLRTGIEISENADERFFRLKFGVVAPYILYAGRIEKGKGLETLFEAFERIRKSSVINLVLMGRKVMDIPEIDGIRYVGYVSEKEKLSAFNGALFSIQPSHYESLSITTLESFSQKTPVLVNRESKVLMEHIELSGGGESYIGPDEFVQKFNYLSKNRSVRKQMGSKGYDYVKKHFSWEVVLEKIDREMRRLVNYK